ncbi:MAG: hypothetical protein A2007_04260 [Verrucomicrobia bacterium GWC2_42_7]|nr:MAG: hypothetical protein A2007_04260 [Verrucomicrobia bacterium GWC2_42_7]
MTNEYLIHIIGTLGSIITSVQFIPQVYKTYKSRSARDISALSFVMCLMGCASWFSYGLLLHSPHLIVTNIFVAMLAGMLLAAKFLFK